MAGSRSQSAQLKVGALSGMTLVVTGASEFSRESVKAFIEDNGGKSWRAPARKPPSWLLALTLAVSWRRQRNWA